MINSGIFLQRTEHSGKFMRLSTENTVINSGTFCREQSDKFKHLFAEKTVINSGIFLQRTQ